jgi:hypothetical protein
MRNRAINALIRMGMPADIKGFYYIVEAMCLFDYAEVRNSRLADLWNLIGDRHKTTGKKVDRAVRKAFDGVLENGIKEEVEKYLSLHNTTNGNLLHVLYIRLKQEEERENGN